MKKIIPNFITIILLSQILSYECNTLKLDNISSNRALTTLNALGYSTVEHTNIYIDDVKLNNLSPMDETDQSNGIFIVDIPDYENYSLNSSDDDDYEESEFNKYLSGTSMEQPTQSDPIERIMVCYDTNQISLYRDFLDLLYNKLDVPAKQILIEALIVEINSDAVKDQGLALDYLNQDEGMNITTPSSDGNPLSLIYSENDFTELLIDIETGEFTPSPKE